MSEEITITDGMPTEQPVQAETTTETVPVVEEQVVVEAPVAEQAAAVQETASESTTPVVIAIPTPEEAAAAEAARIAAKEERERKRAEEQARRQKEQEERAAARQKEQEERAAIFAEIEQIKANNTTLVVKVLEKVKGGLRVDYKGLRLFLPTSHTTLKRISDDADLAGLIGTDVTVHVIDAKLDEQGRTAVVVSRKKIIEEEFYALVKPGDTVTGTVSAVSAFGVFLEFNGMEGLIHVSRLSLQRIADPATAYKRGDTLEAKVISVDKEKNRISLSRREFEPSPWEGVAEKFPVGLRVNGKVKRLTDFGAYIEIAPGIEGLLRNADITWARRIAHPSEVLTAGQEIMLQILATDEAKKRLTLGYKQTLPNPWTTIASTYPVGTEIHVALSQSTPKGLVVRVSDELEGFMPRGRMGGFASKLTSLVPGDAIEAVVIDVDGADETFILAPKDTSYPEGEAPPAAREPRNSQRRDDRNDRAPRESRDRDSVKIAPELQGQQSINLMDLLSEEERSRLRS
jgi:small subunit ribosomal protein S1